MWRSRLLCRLSSYEEVLAAVNIQPLVSSAVEAAKEDLYEVLEEVRCPTLMATARNNCPNEKPGGLAQNIYKCVTSFLPHCLDKCCVVLHRFNNRLYNHGEGRY